MLQNVQSAEASLVAVIREAAAALNSVGTSALDAALNDLARAREAAVARLKNAAALTQLTIGVVTDEAEAITEQLRASVFGAQQSERHPISERPIAAESAQPAQTQPATNDATIAQDATRPEGEAKVETQPHGSAGEATEQSRYRSGFALVDAMLDAHREAVGEEEQPAEPVVTVAANSPVEPAKVQTFSMAEQVERTAQLVEALQGQARDGATSDALTLGLDALGIDSWRKQSLLALARRLKRDVSGKPGKAELVRLVRRCVLDVQALCSFDN